MDLLMLVLVIGFEEETGSVLGVLQIVGTSWESSFSAAMINCF